VSVINLKQLIYNKETQTVKRFKFSGIRRCDTRKVISAIFKNKGTTFLRNDGISLPAD